MFWKMFLIQTFQFPNFLKLDKIAVYTVKIEWTYLFIVNEFENFDRVEQSWKNSNETFPRKFQFNFYRLNFNSTILQVFIKCSFNRSFKVYHTYRM